MRTIRALVALGLMAGTLAVLSATPASAAGCVDIQAVQFDSPGDDNFSNTSLNAEFVKVRNFCGKTVKLKGWTLGDEDATRYTFPKTNLKAKKTITVHTGSGNDNKKNRYIGEQNYIWQNGSDTAVLENKRGKVK
ncbi:MAG: lamin tail domain-containing protein, partial [Actinomycetota bacterium]